MNSKIENLFSLITQKKFRMVKSNSDVNYAIRNKRLHGLYWTQCPAAAEWYKYLLLHHILIRDAFLSCYFLL